MIRQRVISAVVIAVGPDRTQDNRRVLWRHSEPIENRMREHCTGRCMPVAANHIADVVHVPRDRGEFLLASVVLQESQNVACDVGHESDVPETVLGESKHSEVLVRLTNERLDFAVRPYGIDRDACFNSGFDFAGGQRSGMGDR